MLGTFGFASTHRHLLGGYEIRSNLPPPPASGPTLLDYFNPDIDRHGSGLNCCSKDHERTLLSHDPDIPPMTDGLEKEDYLTDSESDDDEAYKKSFVVDSNVKATSTKPSLAAARQILRAPPPAPAVVPVAAPVKGKAAAAAPPTPAPVVAPAPDTGNTNAESFQLKDSDRRNDQVELMRDRKIMDMEAFIRKKRYSAAESFSER